MSGDSFIVSHYGLDGQREHWMPGNRRKGTGPREKKPFSSREDAIAHAVAHGHKIGDPYVCSICGQWHNASPRTGRRLPIHP